MRVYHHPGRGAAARALIRSCFFLLGATAAAQPLPQLGEAIRVPDRPKAPAERYSALPSAIPSTWVDTSNRQAVAESYKFDYLPTRLTPTGWTGDVATGIAGDTTPAYKSAVFQRVNWFRAMAGVPAWVTQDATFSAKAQKGALMLAANGALSHTPPASWKWYTADGAEALGKSNICYSYDHDPGCVALYIEDHGGGNAAVGHRRWIFYPQTQKMGTGDVHHDLNLWNALWVFDANYGGARPSTRDEFVAWPPRGYVPYQVVYPRWSFSFPGANFSQASVTLTRNGAPVAVALEPVASNIGDPTLVWVPAGQSTADPVSPVPPASDETYTVTINNVLVGGLSRNFTYQVIVFNPGAGVTSTAYPKTASVDAKGSNTAFFWIQVDPPGSPSTIQSNVSWAQVRFSNPTYVGYAVDANTGAARTGTITVGDSVHTISQAGGATCNFSVAPPSATLPSAGGNGSFTISADQGCQWSASSTANWLTVVTTFGSGSQTIFYHAQANSEGVRTGTISAGGQTFTITQQGNGCTYSLNPTSNTVAAAGASGNVSVSAGSGCTWTATSNAPWITVNSGTPGSGNGAVTYSVAANTTAAQRSGTITIGGQTFTITQAPPGSAGNRFVPVPPCRIADTRNPNAPFGGPALAGGTSRDFTVPSSACSIPPAAVAYSINVTVVPRGLLGFLTVWPTGQSLPLASTLNSLDGRVKANAAIVPAGTGGAISVFATHTTDVILDINGYFVPAATPSALAFYPLTPCRVADTRNAAGPLGGPALAGAQDRSFPVRSSACSVPSTAQAYSLNFTAIPRGTLGHLTTWPTGGAAPVVSTLNATTGQITANAAIVPAAANGNISVFVTNDADLVIDINGYFAPPTSGGLSFHNLTPCRTLDTREPAGSQPFSGARSTNITASPCGAPPTAQAYVLSATVVPPGLMGFLTLWPQGQAQPTVSTLNALDGFVTSNMAIVPTTNGSISSFALNATHLVLDISGYFAP